MLDVLGLSVLSLLFFLTHTIHSTTHALSLLVHFFFFFLFFFPCPLLFSLITDHLLRSISFSLGAHRDEHGHILSQKEHALQNSLTGVEEEEEEQQQEGQNIAARAITPTRVRHTKQKTRCWCCKYKTYRRVRSCCFLVQVGCCCLLLLLLLLISMIDSPCMPLHSFIFFLPRLFQDADNCHDVRCCIKYHRDCQPNALLSIPKTISNIKLDDPSSSGVCCCCSRLGEWCVRVRFPLLLYSHHPVLTRRPRAFLLVLCLFFCIFFFFFVSLFPPSFPSFAGTTPPSKCLFALCRPSLASYTSCTSFSLVRQCFS